MRIFSQSDGIPVAFLTAAMFCSTCYVQAQAPSPVKEPTVYNRPVVLVASDKLEASSSPPSRSTCHVARWWN